MKLTINVAAFRDALAVSLAKRGTLAVLEHALLAVGADGRLSVTTSDFAQELTFYTAAQVEQPGEPVAARADLLKAAVFALDGEAELSMAAARLVLKQGRRRYNVPCLSGADFPVLQPGASKALDVDLKQLAIALGRVSYCAAQHDIRDYLNGVHMTAQHMAATDGFRMALAPLPCAGLPLAGVIIPAASVKLLRDNLGCATSIALRGDEFLDVRGADFALLTKLARAKSPDLSRIVRDLEPAEVVAHIDVSPMSAALKRMHGFCNVDGASGKSFHQLRLTATADAVEFSAARDIDTVDPVAATMCGSGSVVLDPRLLADMLACVNGAARCEWRQIDGTQGQCFRFDARNDVHIIMPMRA